MTATVPSPSHRPEPRNAPRIRTGAHVFSVDVEDYFHAHALAAQAPRERWTSLPSRVVASTERLLDVLARHETFGTFFVLGWVAERHPHLVRRIADRGHEVATHGHWHERVAPMTPAAFRQDLRRSLRVLEDVIGRQVVGFRAPSFSITPGTEWAFDVMVEEGLLYDSSLFPIRRPGAGHPGCPDDPHVIRTASGPLLEFPLTTTRVAGMRLPAAGGAYLRHLPSALVERAFAERTASGRMGMFYVHPWEVDPHMPVLDGLSPLTRLRHYGGTTRMLARVERLVEAHRFTSVARVLGMEGSLRLAA